MIGEGLLSIKPLSIKADYLKSLTYFSFDWWRSADRSPRPEVRGGLPADDRGGQLFPPRLLQVLHHSGCRPRRKSGVLCITRQYSYRTFYSYGYNDLDVSLKNLFIISQCSFWSVFVQLLLQWKTVNVIWLGWTTLIDVIFHVNIWYIKLHFLFVLV